MKISTVKFTSATNFAVGQEPFFLEAADFNKDGFSDLATVNHTGNNVSILLGNGAGSFSTATNFAVGAKAFSLSIGDFNKDGKVDVATANYQDNNVSVLLGNGTGGFSPATNFAVGTAPLSVITTDLNNDSKPDLVAVNDANNISVLLGNGLGGFSAATDVAVGSYPIAVKSGYLNNDNILDLITVNLHNTNNVSVLLGNGQGGFGAATNVAVGNAPGGMVLADLNKDGKVDLATTNYQTGSLSVLLGNGNGSFGAATTFATGAKPISIIAADFDGDAISDLVTTNMDAGNVSVLSGNGDGSFNAATNFAVGEFPGDVTVGDFNRDGRSDLAVTNRGTNNVSILLNQTNRAPVVANPLAPKSVVSGTALNFALAANTFTDPDAGDVLTYSAKLANGTALPTWLTFNPSTRTFAGTPAAANIGSLNITVTAKDQAGLTATNSFALNVAAPNRAPVVANPLAPKSVVSGTALNFALAANTFTDPDAGDVLTYSAKLANGTALPTWLTFNPTTRTFAGTPAAANIGNLNITVTAKDKAGLTATNSFALNVAAPNRAPVVANPLAPKSVVSGTALNFALAANTFTDPDAGDVLTYSAKLANGTALPTWLTFNPTTRTFAGTPAAANIGNLNITVTAKDKAGLTATNSFALNVAAPNRAPVVANPLAPKSVVSGTALNFALAANTFTDPDAGDVLTYSAKLANGTALPTWLTFNPSTRTFAGTPAAANIGNLNITVTAKDKAGLTATNSFALNVAAPNRAPVVANPLAPKSVVSGTALNFALAANTFTDPDAGDVLTYSAKLANGTALPTWLTFNPTTRTFAGTPAATNIGSLNITVTAKDQAGLTATNSFALNVAASNNVSFTAATNFAVGQEPFFVKAADFNKDGFSDVATVNHTGNNISILLGNGTGSFNTATNFAVGKEPFSLTIGDFNKDGNPDVATANYEDNNISVLLGNGLGSFSAATNFAAGTAPISLITADLNNDNKPDLVAVNDASKLSVLLGNGLGGFGAATNVEIGNYPIAVKVGYVNNDSIPDLITVNLHNTNNLSLLLGNGQGGFGTPTNIAVGNSPADVVLGDFNNDGKIDLATANYKSSNLSVLLGNGNGGFGTATNFATGSKPLSIITTDFNKDGVADLVTANMNDGNVSVLLGNGNGSFGAATNLAVGEFPGDVTIGDFNGDGLSDLAVANRATNNVSILLNQTSIAPLPVSNNAPVPVNNDALVLNVVRLNGSAVDRPIGSESQTLTEGRTIDLTNYSGQILKADIITTGDSGYTNHIGFYTVEDSIGSIKLSNGTFLKPGDANYAVEAIKNALTNSLQAGKIDTKTNLSITGGKIYAPVVVAQGTLTDFVTKNPTNGGGASAIHAYFNYAGANSDKIDHFRLVGNNTFGVEDTHGGGDRDFNDLVVNMNVKTA